MARVVRTPGPGKEQLRVFLEGLKTDKVGKVGWDKSAVYEDGTPVAYVAAIQEFGYPAGGIRSRSFMRSTAAEQRDAWRLLAEDGARAILNGGATIDILLEGIGLQAAGDIAKKITQIHTPALKRATVRARMRRRADGKTVGNLTKPLVDTGYMVNSITNVVEER